MGYWKGNVHWKNYCLVRVLAKKKSRRLDKLSDDVTVGSGGARCSDWPRVRVFTRSDKYST